ncbi:MAG: hypothetical protein AAF578_00465 [Pseudomonadota bacterium]
MISPAQLLEWLDFQGLRSEVVYFDRFEDEWVASNEWLCGTFAGRVLPGNTEEAATRALIEYFDKHKGHDSLVGRVVDESGWPNLSRVAKYISSDEPV